MFEAEQPARQAGARGMSLPVYAIPGMTDKDAEHGSDPPHRNHRHIPSCELLEDGYVLESGRRRTSLCASRKK